MNDIHILIFLYFKSTLYYFYQQFIKYVQEHSIDYYVAEITDESSFTSKAFFEFCNQPNTIMFTFNNIGIDLNTEDGHNFWESKNITVYNFIQDHPRNYDRYLKNPPCTIKAICLDRNHIKFINRFFPEIDVCAFSPNGGTECDSSMPWADRPIDVLYMGCCQPKIVSFPAISFFTDKGQAFYSGTIGYLLNNTMEPTENAIDIFLKTNNLKVPDELLYSLHIDYAPYIEATARRITKLNAIKALSDAGISVEIYGDDWVDPEYPFGDNIRIHERISADEIMRIVGTAKISLCCVPWFKDGCSEKNFDSMLNGAVCISDKSGYLNDNYVDGKNIVYFDLANPIQMASDVKWLLDHPNEASEIAANGKETARKHDTWPHRFDVILAAICKNLQDNTH